MQRREEAQRREGTEDDHEDVLGPNLKKACVFPAKPAKWIFQEKKIKTSFGKVF